MGSLTRLQKLKEITGGRVRLSSGLSDEVIASFESVDTKLQCAIDEAFLCFESIRSTRSDLLKFDEKSLIAECQKHVLNFYSLDSHSPYLPLAACGPWIVTFFGSVIYDTGGYGMVGFGHNPPSLTKALASNYVQANVLTPSLEQLKFGAKIHSKIGVGRANSPFVGYMCLNSGSEALTLALRVSDANAKAMTSEGSRYAGRKIRIISSVQSFHGRTERPARVSDSSKSSYMGLASFSESICWTVLPNDIEGLKKRFEQADRDGVFIEALLVEPVMGEGNPGMLLSRKYYDLARQLTLDHGSLFIVDSVQSAIRACGKLSIVDYPGFEDCVAPDMEAYSKAINAAQYPLSVLSLTKRACDLYKPGMYGNTMCAAPRALEVACQVLELITPELEANICARGKEFLEHLKKLMEDFPGIVTQVQGTGLLLSAQLDSRYPVCGENGVEQWVRRHGVNVIHGGSNGLRFTPHFNMGSKEIELVLDIVRSALNEYAS